MLKEGDTFSSLFSQNKKHLDHHHHLTSKITMTCHLHHDHHNHKSDSECNKEETPSHKLRDCRHNKTARKISFWQLISGERIQVTILRTKIHIFQDFNFIIEMRWDTFSSILTVWDTQSQQDWGRKHLSGSSYFESKNFKIKREVYWYLWKLYILIKMHPRPQNWKI